MLARVGVKEPPEVGFSEPSRHSIRFSGMRTSLIRDFFTDNASDTQPCKGLDLYASMPMRTVQKRDASTRYGSYNSWYEHMGRWIRMYAYALGQSGWLI